MRWCFYFSEGFASAGFEEGFASADFDFEGFAAAAAAASRCCGTFSVVFFGMSVF